MDKLKSRLDSFSDGVIAIIITIMILNIEPVIQDSLDNYLILGKALGIYLISFIFVANMWYQHSLIFGDFSKITYRIIILNMTFLASLSFIPLFTKMMANNTTSITVMIYGATQFLVNTIFRQLAVSVAKIKYSDEETVFTLYQKIYGSANLRLRILSFTAFIVAYFAPRLAIIFYLAYPILMFVLNTISVRRMASVSSLPIDQQEDFIHLSSTDKSEFFKEQNKMLHQQADNPISETEQSIQAWLDQSADSKSSNRMKKVLSENMTKEQKAQMKEWLKNRR